MLDNPYKHIVKVSEQRRVFFQGQNPQEIWKEVLQKDQSDMKRLCEAMSQLVYDIGVPKILVHFGAKILYHIVYKPWGHYLEESDYLASQCSNISSSMMAFLQRQYTLAHMGCSVVMQWDDKTEQMLCFRSLDWKGSDDIAHSTRRFSFVNRKNEEVAQVAGITAMVGVLTGVKKGFSICINYAPWKRSAKFKSDPTFLIRQLLEDENITNYKEALQCVKTWEVGSPCFISLCGITKEEACVIELCGKSRLHIRNIDESGLLIQTNHYSLSSSPFVKHNEEKYEQEMSERQWYDSELLRNSQKREEVIRKNLECDSQLGMEEKLISVFKKVPVLNWESAQWVIMKPALGEIEVYSCVDK